MKQTAWLALLWGACTPKPLFSDYLEASGMTRFLGDLPPDAEITLEDGVKRQDWDVTDTSPICMDQSAFHTFTREGTSDDLTIFLQGGGACWSTFCLAAPFAPETLPRVDVLDPDLPSNPYRTHRSLYVPYCDGSLFVGDADSDQDADGAIDRTQRGLRNLSAALDVAHHTFPSPTSITLIGASGGGYGTFLASALVRHLWPDAPIDVVNDAGVGIGEPDNPAFVRSLLDEWNAQDALPADCEDCYPRGHITAIAGWLLDRDPAMRYAMISSAQDQVIGQWFLHLTGEAFEQALLGETKRLEGHWEGRFGRFIYPGTGHTATLGTIDGAFGMSGGGILDGVVSTVGIGSLDTVHANGVSIADWLADMKHAHDWRSTIDRSPAQPSR